jgi:hypothetical protein
MRCQARIEVPDPDGMYSQAAGRQSGTPQEAIASSPLQNRRRSCTDEGMPPGEGLGPVVSLSARPVSRTHRDGHDPSGQLWPTMADDGLSRE